MIAISVILKIIKSKYFWLALILAAIGSYIAFLNINIKSKENKIKDLNNEIIALEATNTLLYKDISFKSNQMMINETFTNSYESITRLDSIKLDNNSIKALNNIFIDYYKLYSNEVNK